MPIIIGDNYVPPLAPAQATSADNRLTATLDTVYGGVLLTANSVGVTPGYKYRFMRDGVPVRSGDMAWAPGGRAVAYDHEAPLGVTSTWTAQRFTRTGVPYTILAGPVALMLGDVDRTFDFWIKSISNPNLSMRIATHGDAPELSQTGRNSLVDIPQSPVHVGSWDVSVNAPRSFEFRTKTLEERDRFLKLLSSGPVLVQSLRLFGISDFYALTDDVKESYPAGGYDPRRVFVVTFVPIARPGTAGAPLYIPGRSYADIADTYATYDELDAAVPTYLDVVDP